VDILALGWGVIAFAAAAFVAGGLVKGVLGIGLPLVVIPLLATVLDVPSAVALMPVPVLASNIQQMFQGKGVIWSARRFATLILPMLVATVIAAQFMAAVDFRTGSLVLGVIVILFCLIQAFPLRTQLPERSERWAHPVTGVITGFLGGLSNLFGPPLTMYLVALRLDRDEFIAATATIFTIGSTTLYITMAINGLLTLPSLGVSAMATLPVMAGVALGSRLRGRLPDMMFRRALLLALGAIGLNLILGAI